MLHIFTALACEAMPLIEHWQLKEQKQHELFRIFIADDNSVSLVITGVSKTLSAAAVSYHHACCHTSPADTWLNIGIAGHIDLELGEACLANKITDAASGKNWYPQILFKTPCPVMSLHSLDKPSEDYQPVLYDMESSGFYGMASRLGTSELIHCIKIVSDNSHSHTGNIKAKVVKGYVESRLETIDTILSSLNVLSNELEQAMTMPAGYEEIVDRWHFTQTQRLQLRECLRRWQTLRQEVDTWQVIDAANSARSVLHMLTDEISRIPFTLDSQRSVQE